MRNTFRIKQNLLLLFAEKSKSLLFSPFCFKQCFAIKKKKKKRKKKEPKKEKKRNGLEKLMPCPFIQSFLYFLKSALLLKKKKRKNQRKKGKEMSLKSSCHEKAWKSVKFRVLSERRQSKKTVY